MQVYVNSKGERVTLFGQMRIDQMDYNRNVALYDPLGPGPFTGLYDFNPPGICAGICGSREDQCGFSTYDQERKFVDVKPCNLWQPYFQGYKNGFYYDQIKRDLKRM